MESIEALLDNLTHQLKICDIMLKQLTDKLEEVRQNTVHHKRRRVCRGCQEDQPNQLAHYGGCIPDPNE